MNESHPLYRQTLLLWLIAVTLAFAWILLPFYGAILWAIVMAIVFAPIHRRLLTVTGQRRTLSACLTLLLFLVLVFIPLTLIATSLLQESAGVFEKIKSGEMRLNAHFHGGMDSLPPWLAERLARWGINDLASLQASFASAVRTGGKYVASKALNIGQNTAEFAIGVGLMLYLLFAFLRDGVSLVDTLQQATPMKTAHKQLLLARFTTVIRATVKGNMLVAAIQGALGGGMFWLLGIPGALLWGLVMAILSLVPAVGAGIIWAPVAIYLLMSGAVWQGIGLILYGVLVIGLIDNILRPVLVGNDAQMPDYLVLISTLGGIAIFGLNGFVIGPVIAALFIATWGLFSSDKITLDPEKP